MMDSREPDDKLSLNIPIKTQEYKLRINASQELISRRLLNKFSQITGDVVFENRNSFLQLET